VFVGDRQTRPGRRMADIYVRLTLIRTVLQRKHWPLTLALTARGGPMRLCKPSQLCPSPSDATVETRERHMGQGKAGQEDLLSEVSLMMLWLSKC